MSCATNLLIIKTFLEIPNYPTDLIIYTEKVCYIESNFISSYNDFTYHQDCF